MDKNLSSPVTEEKTDHRHMKKLSTLSVIKEIQVLTINHQKCNIKP